MSPITPFLNSPRVVATSALPSYASTYLVSTAGLPYGFGSGLGQVLTASAPGALPAIDGVTLSAYDAFLLTAGAVQQDNQLYLVENVGSASTPWVLRSEPWVCVAYSGVPPGETKTINSADRQVVVQQGTVYGGTTWRLQSPNPIVMGTSALVWVQV